MSANVDRLSEAGDEWAGFLENWKTGLTKGSSMETPVQLRQQWRNLLQQYSRKFNSLIQTPSDFESDSSIPPQPFAPWAMDNIDHNILDQLLNAEFSHHYQRTASYKKRSGKASALKRLTRSLGLSVWKIYLYLGEDLVESRDCMNILNSLFCSRFKTKTPAGGATEQYVPPGCRREYLEKVIYPKILSTAVSRRGPTDTTAIACARPVTRALDEGREAPYFRMQDLVRVKKLMAPSGYEDEDDDDESTYEPSVMSSSISEPPDSEIDQAESVVEVHLSRPASASRQTTPPLHIDRNGKRRANTPIEDGPRRKRSRIDFAQILAPLTVPTTNICDWLQPDNQLSASLIHISLSVLVAAQQESFVVLQPPAEGDFQGQSPIGGVEIDTIQELVRSLSAEQKTNPSNFTLLLPLKCDDSWVLASVFFGPTQGSVELFDPLYNGNDNDILDLDRGSYKPLKLVQQLLDLILPPAPDGRHLWAWKASIRKFPGHSKVDSGASACLAAMYLVSGTSLPAEIDPLLARRLLFRLLASAAHLFTPSPPQNNNTVSAVIAATGKELHDLHVQRFRDKISSRLLPRERSTPARAATSSQPGGMINLLESNCRSSLAAVEFFKQRHETLSKGEALSIGALKQSSQLIGVVLLLLHQVRKSQTRIRVKLGHLKVAGDARRFRLQFQAIALALDVFEREGSGTGGHSSDSVQQEQQEQQQLEAEGVDKSPEDRKLLLRLDTLDVLERALELMITDLNGWQKEINAFVADM
ncbi:hypothetical protein VP1G_10046 [Cytospora mali]|uniref:Uncharacterized protein n=1 Tax=Cytospora mali TaxID=578113 RepID=A0A194VGD5_CYTMA|nr:hypothetical protein VP1G_10046 [Valsa mali var. pyri (nom. inval.)]